MPEGKLIKRDITGIETENIFDGKIEIFIIRKQKTEGLYPEETKQGY